MRKIRLAALLSGGLQAWTPISVIATTSRARSKSEGIVAIVQGAGELEMWVSVRRVAPQQGAILGHGNGAVGAVVGGTAGALTPTRRCR
jgi:hypothetical protein